MRLTLFSILIFLGLFIQGQNLVLDSLAQIRIDELGNIYKIYPQKLVTEKQGKIYEYTNRFLGPIHVVDISNPLRILVYFKESNTVVFLDNSLSPIGNEIQLDEQSLFEIGGICNSEINGFWVFNVLEQRLQFFDSQMNKQHESRAFNELLSGEVLVQDLQMIQKQIYVDVKNKGILVFDMFGAYLKTLPFKTDYAIQISEPQILYIKENAIRAYHTETLEDKLVFKAESPLLYFRLIGKTLFYQEGKILKSINK
ncbi:MAG: hypothetical protein JXR60_09825 [Bacteroidales bacterium]|nr:hypothetical protein [Bacteroidales bacterium]